MDIIETLGGAGIIPVIVIENEADAVPLARALVGGGLPVLEVTFRTKAAAAAIAAIRSEVPDAVVGAGTVLTTQQADAAMAAGAKFIVTPGFNPEVVGHCVEKGYPIFPGCPTTSDIEQAIRFGLKVVKFFPAEAMGGLYTIKAVKEASPLWALCPSSSSTTPNTPCRCAGRSRAAAFRWRRSPSARPRLRNTSAAWRGSCPTCWSAPPACR